MTTTIVWDQPLQAFQSRFLEHHFSVSGPDTAVIHAWLMQDNEEHGEWRLNPLGVERFAIWANLDDAAAVRRVERHISRLKLAWDAPERSVFWMRG